MPTSVRWATLLAVIAVIASCSSPLEPADVAGTYVLERIDGTAIGSIVNVGGIPGLHVEYDTLVLRADGSTRVARVYSGLPPSSGFGATIGDGTFELDGNTILVAQITDCGGLVCGFSADRRLQRTAGGLTERDSGLGLLGFRRVGAAPSGE